MNSPGVMSPGRQSKDELRDLLRTMRNEVRKFSKDLAEATQRAVDSTERAVRRVSPRVTESIDESIKDVTTSFHRVMESIDGQTRNQQVKVLRTYKLLLSRQADAIERRLRKLSE